MWKRKVSIKEQYGSLKHFLKGDEDCHYIGQRYIEGTNIFARREWRGVKDTSYAFYRWLVTWVKMGGLVARDPVRTGHDRSLDRRGPGHGPALRPDRGGLHDQRLGGDPVELSPGRPEAG